VTVGINPVTTRLQPKHYTNITIGTRLVSER